MSEVAMDSRLRSWQSRAVIIGLVAAAISMFGAVVQRAQFFQSYLFAWLFWSGLSFGSLAILMLQFLTGGEWGIAVRGLAAAAMRILPLTALFFLPVLIGAHCIYAWADGAVGDSAGYRHKAQYLNVPFFALRAACFFGVLILFAASLRRAAAAAASERKIAALSAGGLIVYVLSMNFASTDWVMSLDAKWYSTIFVEIFVVGQFLSALALLTALLAIFAGELLDEAKRAKVFHDLGNLLLAFVIFWTYVSFAQFLIIWSGNLPKEISWYLDRSRGGWQWLAVLLALVQFFLPFALLLSREAKRTPQRLGGIALLIFLANALANFWFVAPSFHPRGFYLHWLDVSEFVALGALWLAAFCYFVRQETASLVPRPTAHPQNV